MIPYDDLVAALQAWRARQGLPVSTQQVANPSNGQPQPSIAAQSSRPGTPPPPPPAPPTSGKRTTTAPRMPVPLPLAPVDTADEHLDALEVEEHDHEESVEPSLIEESHYENEGDDFAMSFGANGNGHRHGHGQEHAAPPPSDETLVGEDVPDANDPARSHNTREDW
ncbi:MAG TPA: hypothetical protein VH143_12560 [Kofleriaceae bacterium]|jgi:hypothetical protein|nr:hypothetical protein [Kofleriaceae bacterium]